MIYLLICYLFEDSAKIVDIIECVCVRASLGNAPPVSRSRLMLIWNISKSLQVPDCTMVKVPLPRPARPALSCVYVFTAKSWWEIGKNYRL